MTRPAARFIGVLLLTAASVASAATVRRAEETSLTGKLVTLHDGKLLIVPDGATAPTAVPLDDIVEVTFADTPAATTRAATQPAAQATAVSPASRPTTQTATTATARIDPRPWQLKLTTPDTLTLAPTAWAGGRVSGTVVDGVAVDVPVAALRELWCGTAEQIAAAKALGETAATDDIAFAVRDKKVIAVRGVAEGVTDGALRFKFDEQTRTITLNRLVGVVFAKASASESHTAAPQQAVSISGNDSLPGTWTGLDAATARMTTAWGQSLAVPRARVTRVAFRNGRVVSLSDLKPSAVEQTPYFDRLLGWQIDRGLDGKPLQLNDGPVARGLAVHSRTVLTYSLDGAFAQFRSRVGFQQPGGRLGEAVLRVTGDGRTLFEKNDAKGTESPADITVNVEGVKSLSLEVDFGANQDVGDRVVWGLARLIRPQAPSTQPTAP